MGENFCLQWNNFGTNVSSAFQDLRSGSNLFDVSLGCPDSAGRPLQAHKIILSACSMFFKNIFCKQTDENVFPKMFIYLKGISYADMKLVLEFMYNREVSVNKEKLNSFLNVVEELQINVGSTGLTCTEILGNNVQAKPITNDNAMQPQTKTNNADAKDMIGPFGRSGNVQNMQMNSNNSSVIKNYAEMISNNEKAPVGALLNCTFCSFASTTMNELMVHVTDKHRHGTKNPTKADVGIENKMKFPRNDRNVEKPSISKILSSKFASMSSTKPFTAPSTGVTKLPSTRMTTTPSAKVAMVKSTIPNNPPQSNLLTQKVKSEKQSAIKSANNELARDMKNDVSRSTRKRKEHKNYEESSDSNEDSRNTDKKNDPKKNIQEPSKKPKTISKELTESDMEDIEMFEIKREKDENYVPKIKQELVEEGEETIDGNIECIAWPPKKGSLIATLFDDDFYIGKVKHLNRDGSVNVFYMERHQSKSPNKDGGWPEASPDKYWVWPEKYETYGTDRACVLGENIKIEITNDVTSRKKDVFILKGYKMWTNLANNSKQAIDQK